jgi:hypothetical protein
MGVTILAYLGLFAALAFGLLGAVGLVVPQGEKPLLDVAPLSLLGQRVVGSILVAFAILLVVASIGMLRQRRWAWLLGLALVAFSAGGDVARVARRDWGGLVGVFIVASMLWYLMRREVRAWFNGP